MMRSIDDWVIAVRDCGVVRVRFDDDALIAGIELGLFDAVPVDEDEDALDVSLAPNFKFSRKPARTPSATASGGPVQLAATLPSPAASSGMVDCAGSGPSFSPYGPASGAFSPTSHGNSHSGKGQDNHA